MSFWLNVLLLFVVAGLTYIITLCLDYKPAPGEQPAIIKSESGIVPDFTFFPAGGRSFTMRQFKGKIVLLNFWASWCPPCVEEFPDLLRIAQESKGRVVLIALSSDHDEEAMNRFLEKMKSQGHTVESDNILIALDPMSRITQGLFQTVRLPETIIIDKNQNLAGRLIGADWTPEDLRDFLKELR